jgi:hypothetical protein
VAIEGNGAEGELGAQLVVNEAAHLACAGVARRGGATKLPQL